MAELTTENQLSDKESAQSLDEFIENAYRRYAVLTILDRALPDARDGLKPVQRRILYAMHYMNINSQNPHKKSARVVGEVMGKFHPHGDQSIYDAMVRMAQPFAMRDPLVDGQGNYGSIDGDPAAAMRYTEARLTPLGEAMLVDIEKQTVDWQTNFDDTLEEPGVLPTRFPNLLVNGSSGIAVGMATSILPHNLGEVCEAVVFVCKQWKNRDKITTPQLMEFIPGPDLPTGGLIYRYRADRGDSNIDIIEQAYETGHGTIICQSRADIKEIAGGKSEIIVTELPYQVQKNTILERIASHKDQFPGLTDVRDESDYNGMRIVFEMGRNANPEEVLDQLLTHTQMRNSLSHNALALIEEHNGGDETYQEPRYLSLKDFLVQFISHRLDVITRRAKYELKRAEDRLHLVEGLLKALSMIDEVVAIIRRSQTTETARTNLIKALDLSVIQAQAILDMPLRRLVSLERKKLVDEEKELKAAIKELKNLLTSEQKRLATVIDETNAIRNDFATPRRTIIIDVEEGHEAQMTVADLVRPEGPQIVRISQKGIFRTQARGFRDSASSGKPTSRAVEIDFFRKKFQAENDVILVTNQGRLWYGPVGRIPESAEFSDFKLRKNEKIVAVEEVTANSALCLVTTAGNIKRTLVSDIESMRSEAVWVSIIGLQDDDDEVLFACVADEEDEVMIATGGSEETSPRCIRIELSSVNPQATPSAKGVVAIKQLDDVLINAQLIRKSQKTASIAAFLTENGWLKKVSLNQFPVQGRGSQGVKTWKVNHESGYVIDFVLADPQSAIDIYSAGYKRLRLSVEDIPTATSRVVKGIDLNAEYGEGGALFSDDRVIGMVAL